MKLNARWALPVYPFLKDQSYWKMCVNILKKERPNTNQILWIVKKGQKTKNCNILVPKTPKNDLLTLNYGLPSRLTTIGTWMTTKRGLGPLIKLSARWEQPVYHVV